MVKESTEISSCLFLINTYILYNIFVYIYVCIFRPLIKCKFRVKESDILFQLKRIEHLTIPHNLYYLYFVFLTLIFSHGPSLNRELITSDNK